MSAPIVALTMPKWGIEMTEGTINAWRVAAGQTVSKGDPLIDVETDKIVNTVEAPAAGTLRRLTAAEGDVRPVGSLLGVFAPAEVTEGEIDAFIASFRGERVSFEPDADSTAVPSAAASDRRPSRPAIEGPTSSSTPVASNLDAANEARISPFARRLAEQLGIDLAQVKGTGRNGRVSKEDVEAYAATLTQTNPSTRKRMSATRVTIATRLQESSQTIPHYRLATTATAERLLALRREFAGRGVELSLNDLLIRAAALSLVRHRALNARLDEHEIVEYQHADIAIAVATDNGLITPVLRRADLKSPQEIARESADLVTRARGAALTRGDLEGGTFTISNLGMFGVERFDAIINPPQVAILAVGSARPSVVAVDGKPTIAQVMTLTLSADHRVIDGAVAAQFLATLKSLIESGDL
jgi:pyruvate dehydrogenase E2 component (dihydrolipoamide acetyltransferase)